MVQVALLINHILLLLLIRALQSETQYIRSGVLSRKHLYERTNKKASHRSWRKCYVTVDRGTVAMYKIEGRNGGGPLDGRELTDTSLQLGTVSLRHTMTQILPPPGYNKARPFVFALQLPNGGVYLFQTQNNTELCEWVDSCNYWASCESKAPYMIGGVFNMEYGWDNTGDFVKQQDRRDQMEENGETLSDAEKYREELRIQSERENNRTINILNWVPPNNPMQRSEADEPSQLRMLLHHISYLEEDLVSHKKVMGSIEERFFPRTPQHQKAFQNWERKAQYILKELIKYQTYADCLQKAIDKVALSTTNNNCSGVNSPNLSSSAIGNGNDSGTVITYHSFNSGRSSSYAPPPSAPHHRHQANGSGTPGTLDIISESDGSQTHYSSIKDDRQFNSASKHQHYTRLPLPSHHASYSSMPPQKPTSTTHRLNSAISHDPVLTKQNQSTHIPSAPSSNTIVGSDTPASLTNKAPITNDNDLTNATTTASR